MKGLIVALVLVSSAAICQEPWRNPPAQAVTNAEQEWVRALADPAGGGAFQNNTPRVIISVSRPSRRGPGRGNREPAVRRDAIQEVRVFTVAGEPIPYRVPDNGGVGAGSGGGVSWSFAYHLVNAEDFQELGRVTFKYRDHEYSFDLSRVLTEVELLEATRAMQENRSAPRTP